MTDIRGLVQTTLDNALYSEGVYSYWVRKSEAQGQDPDEYIVYTLGGDSIENYADDISLVKSADVTIRYYYRDSLLDNHSGRTKVKDRELTIANALYAAGFSIPNGAFDAGDIDDIGFGTIVMECEYWRVE